VPPTCDIAAAVTKGCPIAAVSETAGFRLSYKRGLYGLRKTSEPGRGFVFVVVVVPIHDLNPALERARGRLQAVFERF
jgi:hypothetical protein